MPHLLFYGEKPGTGKTSAAQALARDLYGDQWRHHVLDMNASDERGIDVIRGKVKEFARTASLGEAFHLILLDEADNLTSDAQGALRRTMEDFSGSTRFILLCNKARRVIPPIQSRCARFQFSPLKDEEVEQAVVKVCEQEGIEIEADAVPAIAQRARGSLRDALNILESSPRPITASSVEEVALDPGIWEEIVAKAVTKGGVREAERMMEEQIIKGASSDDVFQGMYDALSERLPDAALDVVLPKLGDREYYTAVGGSLSIQSRSFLRFLAGSGKVNQ